MSDTFTLTGTNVFSITAGLYSSVALSSSTDPSAFGQSVTFIATVASNGSTPTGTVTFYDGNTPLDTETLDATGSAIFTTAALSVDTHALTAAYSGDANNSSDTSEVLTQKVDAAARTRPRQRHAAVRRSRASRRFVCSGKSRRKIISEFFHACSCQRRLAGVHCCHPKGVMAPGKSPALLSHVSRLRSDLVSVPKLVQRCPALFLHHRCCNVNQSVGRLAVRFPSLPGRERREPLPCSSLPDGVRGCRGCAVESGSGRIEASCQ